MNRLVVVPLNYFYSEHRNPFPQKVSLGEGYTLQSFDGSILDTAFDVFTESYTERERDDLKHHPFAIYYRYESEQEGPEIPLEVINEIHRITQTLRIVKQTRAIPTMFHFNIERRRKEPLQIIHEPPTNITFPPGEPGSQHFNKQDAHKLRLYVGRVRDLYTNFGGTHHRVLNAAIFFEIGHQNHIYKPRLVHFVTCLESLFNTSSQQIGYSLRVRCSYFLRKSPGDREDLAGTIKQIYQLRSHFVHGQAIPNRILNNQGEQYRLLLAAENIARECLQKIFDKDLAATFNNRDVLDSEFAKLELGGNSILR